MSRRLNVVVERDEDGHFVAASIEMSEQEVAALKELTRHDAGAVAQAAREFLRLCRLRELKNASGKVEFDLNWQALEDLELGESTIPM